MSDTFASGSINGQNGWFVDPAASFDEAVVDLGAGAYRGKGVWKLSNAVVSGGFGNQPQSPVLTPTAGESTVRGAGGGDTVCTSFWIRPVSAVADGSAFTFSHSPASADRHDWIRFENDSDSRKGLSILGLDTLDSTSAFDSRNFDVATNLPRSNWTQVVILTTSPDGPHNDVVKVYVNGTLRTTMSTWEDWRFASGYATLDVARALFRISSLGTALDPAFTSPQGWYIDDFIQVTYDAAVPAAVKSQYKTGFELP